MSVFDSKLYEEQIGILAERIPEKECTILVTGATGMIGSCIIDTILYTDYKYGNRIKVVASGRKLSRLQDRFNYSGMRQISFIEQDIQQPFDADEPIDYIIHTASNADPLKYSLYPVETMLTNLYGTDNMLKYCSAHKKTRILLTSSFETYGKIINQDKYAEYDSGEIALNEIRSCYPESKRCAEILLRCYAKEYEVDGVIARLCSIYGPTMEETDSKAHAQFIRNGISGKDIVLKSKGNQRRTYCYLLDAVDAILKILFTGKSGEAYNVANESCETSIAELAQLIAKICGVKVIYERAGEIEQKGYSREQNCILDNSKLRSLGWEGMYSLCEGVESTIKILKEAGFLNE